MLATDLDVSDADFLRRTRGRLKSMRQRSGLTLDEVAAEAGMSKSALSRLESGARPLSLLHLCRLARALNTTPEAFLTKPPLMNETDPAVHRTPDGRQWQQLAVPAASAFHAHLISFSADNPGSDERSHAGRQWIFVLTGSLRLKVGGRARTLHAGDQASFSTQLAHELRAEDTATVLLSLFHAT